MILRIAFSIIVALMLWPAKCFPANLELGIGQSNFNLAGDNIWWQDYYSHQQKLRSLSFQIGLQQNLWVLTLPDAQVGLRLAYVDLGKASNTADWNSDVNYNAGVKTCSPWCAHSSSHWKAWGLSLGPTIEKSSGNWKIGLEAGAFAYKAGGQVQYSTTVGRDLDQGINDGICNVAYKWRSTWYAGATLQYKSVFVAFRQYDDIRTANGDKIGLLGGHTQTAMLGLQLKF